MTNPPLAAGITAKLDYLKAVIRADRAGYLLAAYRPYFGPAVATEGTRDHYTGQVHKWECGAWVVIDPTRGNALVCFPGKALDMIGADQWGPMVAYILGELGGRLVRADTALDLHGRREVIDRVHEAADAGNVVGFRSIDVRQPTKIRAGKPEPTGHGVYLGLRGKDGAGRFVRCYDKWLETDGQVDAARLEVEHTGKVAELLGGLLLDEADSPGHFTRLIARQVVGAMDFRDRDGGRVVHRERMPRLAWWAELVDQVTEGVRLVAHRVKPTITSTIEWLDRGVSTSLAKLRIVCDSVGVSFALVTRILLDNGEAKLCPTWGDAAHVRGVNPLEILRK